MSTRQRINHGVIARAIVLMIAGACASETSAQEKMLLKNGAVLRELAFDGQVWRTVRFARADGSDALNVQSDEFHVLALDNTEYSLDQYKVLGEPTRERKDGVERLVIRYAPRTNPALPGVTITYSLGQDPHPRKTVQLAMREGEMIDRLEVERFSVAEPAERGGRGEPVFVNNLWWFGVEYPAFYSRHTDGNTPKWQEGPYDRKATFPSVIQLDGRDIERQPRPGLIRFMHFPGAARKLADGSWGIVSKTAVCGVKASGLTMELSFRDYLMTICRPLRSLVNYNNWYDPVGKKLTISNFVEKTFLPMRDALQPYGVKIDAMVVDDGWQNPNSIYQPDKKMFPEGWADVARLSRRLEQEGTHFGIWLALNGYGLNMKWGAENGYKEAVRNAHFSHWAFNRYYSLADPKYNGALREVLAHLLVDGRVTYFKHDFNNMCNLEPTGQPHTDRHGHETEVNAVLELLAFERQLNPEVFQNMTNWIWYSPWWLQACDTLWMLSGDGGMDDTLPDLSALGRESRYRDRGLIRAWGLGEKRPLIPMSHLMTHGIIYSETVNGQEPSPMRDFADYVMMYYVRGLKLKEWYLTPRILSAEHWRALGTATRWAVENQQTLQISILFGELSQLYGYMSWEGARGILAVRNSTPGARPISVPFDQSVFYRGATGVAYRARVIYPYQASLPSSFCSGQPMQITVPGYSLMVLELEPGVPEANTAGLEPSPVGWQDGNLTLPDEASQRCDILVIGNLIPAIDGKPLAPVRNVAVSQWQMADFDLKPWRGKRVAITFSEVAPAKEVANPGRAPKEAWLLLDRPVADAAADNDPRRPWAIEQGYRRQTVQLWGRSRSLK